MSIKEKKEITKTLVKVSIRILEKRKRYREQS